MDSFKLLFDEEDPVPEQMLRNVEQRVQGTARPIRFAGDTADLYLNKVGHTLVAFFGGGRPTKRYNGSAASPTDSDAPPGGRN
jgi:hypothetical protein